MVAWVAMVLWLISRVFWVITMWLLGLFWCSVLLLGLLWCSGWLLGCYGWLLCDC